MILEGNQQRKTAHKLTRGNRENTDSFLRQPILKKMQINTTKKIFIASILGVGLLTGGCGSFPNESAEAESQSPRGRQEADSGVPVDASIARSGMLREEPEYTGTTTPFRTVSLRSRVEGQLLALNVDVGDAVKQGQIIAQIDDALLRTAQNQAEAELAALKSEVARTNAQISNARAQVERLRAELVQAQADSQRQQQLLKEGAIAQQVAQQSRTESLTAAQSLRAAQETVRTEQQALAAAQGRVVAQQAVVAEAKERRSYSKLTSPVTGVVLEKITEPGNLLQAGNEVVRLGDFSRVKVVVQLSELELGKIRLGQSVKVRLDAFANQTYTGQVTRISPAADTTARLIPVEVVISNSDRKIGSGLLARVNFETQTQARVIIPETALQGRDGGARTDQQKQNTTASSSSAQSPNSNRQGTVFVVAQTGEKATVTERTVTLGERSDGNVEVLSGLQPGEKFVTRSGKPLKDRSIVRLSILSEQQS
ncbi:efflux transporter periplasmic adaptor subunit [Brasilonema octagenarum UFV-OR1]|uniref:Efflux transporter periplasmic adaptor subunit n=2 Tax=Octagenarum group TaxID=3398494 RepID=A0ABX1LYR8_9CYAN|nr:efflux transporter periplasmic adaptor subunit [Brasilonema octagenarum UFV-OR1]